MIKKIISHPLFSGSTLMIGGSMAVNVFNYAYHLIMGRMLTPSDYGVLASVFSILYIVSIVPVSSSFAIVKFISEAENEREQTKVYLGIRRLIVKVSIVGAILILISSPFISRFLYIQNVSNIILVGPIMFLSLIILVDQASLQGKLNFFGVVGPNFVSSVSKLILGVLFVYLGFSVFGAIVGVLLGLVVTYFFTLKIKGSSFTEHVKSNFDPTKFLKYAFPVLVQALAFTSFFTVDLILAKHFLSAFDAGLYAALSMLGKIIFFAVQPITATMFPIVSRRKAKGEYYMKVVILSLIATIAISTSVVAFYYLFPKLAIGILYGEKYLKAASELVWMGIFMIFYTLDYIMVNFLLSIDKTKIVFLPIAASFVQIILIYYFHNSILQIIFSSVATMTLLFFGIASCLGYNLLHKSYAKR